jgi:hypothetical protein
MLINGVLQHTARDTVVLSYCAGGSVIMLINSPAAHLIGIFTTRRVRGQERDR